MSSRIAMLGRCLWPDSELYDGKMGGNAMAFGKSNAEIYAESETEKIFTDMEDNG